MKQVVSISVDSFVLEAFDLVLEKSRTGTRSAALTGFMLEMIKQHPEIQNHMYEARTQALLLSTKAKK